MATAPSICDGSGLCQTSGIELSQPHICYAGLSDLDSPWEE